MLSGILNIFGLRKEPGVPPTESWLAKLLREAATSTAGSGVSSTKLVWLSNGMLSCYCATLATLAGVSTYIFKEKADPVYWTAVGAMWAVSTGFATSAKKNQTQAAKEISIASQQATPQGTTDQGGEK